MQATRALYYCKSCDCCFNTILLCLEQVLSSNGKDEARPIISNWLRRQQTRYPMSNVFLLLYTRIVHSGMAAIKSRRKYFPKSCYCHYFKINFQRGILILCLDRVCYLSLHTPTHFGDILANCTPLRTILAQNGPPFQGFFWECGSTFHNFQVFA